MPSYTYDDRKVLDAENALWICWTILGDAAHDDNDFTREIVAVREAVQKIAQELRSYNEQFEEEDDA